jgi:hypothetical protein
MTTTRNVAENFLRDLGGLLKEIAREAKVAKETSLSPEERSYAVGRLMALHEIVSLMQHQAVAFGLQPDDIGLADIDPERELI